MNLDLVLALASLGTATVSGVLGMAGGLLLFGVYSSVLPIASAVVLHSGTQLLSNVGRVVVQRQYVLVGPVLAFTAGALPVYGLFRWWAPQIDAPRLFLLLGGLTLGSFFVPRLSFMDASRPTGSMLAGAATTAAQLTGGVGGPLMDVFWVDVNLDRRTVVATKALTTAVAHVLRIAFWAPLASGAWTANIGGQTLVGIAAATFAGTMLGSAILTRMGDKNFRATTRVVVIVLGTVYLVRGVIGVA